MKTNKIGFGIFCFGEDYYYKGAYEKLYELNRRGYVGYVLTENPKYFNDLKLTNYIIPYYRSFKSYHDKMILPKHILNDYDICILIDADLEIKDWSFLDDLRHYKFQPGISYVDVLLNHPERKEFVSELNLTSNEWNEYSSYCKTIYPDFKTLNLIWEYFITINKEGFNPSFYEFYDRLQIKKESCHIFQNKDVYAPGEGITTTISAKLSNTNIQRDLTLYELVKDKMISVSTRFSR